MSRAPSELETHSTNRLMLWRVRIIMLICAAGGVTFGGKELLRTGHTTPQFWTQILGITLSTSTFFVLKRPAFVPRAWPVSVFVISFAYFLTALAGVLSPTGEYATTTVLFVGAALTTATIVPWGVTGQVATLFVGVTSLAVAVHMGGGTPSLLVTDPGMATAIAFGWSIVIAYEIDRYRNAHRRELLGRRRGERAILRLNARLEQRVAERTAQLRDTNAALVREAAERVEVQRRLADIVDHSSTIIALKDPAGRYVLVNRAFESVFGRPRQEVIGRSDLELFPAAAADMTCHDQDVLATREAISFEQALTAEGVERTFVFVKFPLWDTTGRVYGVGIVATDISHAKRLQEELRRHQDELAHVLRLNTITEIAAGLAHEINQPLGAINNFARGSVQRLRLETTTPRELLDVMERIAEEAVRAGQILRGLRTLVQPSTQTTESIDVNALAGEAVRVLDWRARQPPVTVRLERASHVCPVRADAVQIEQVMLNLILNGIEAVERRAAAGGEVVVSTSSNAAGVEVAVSDTGEGVPAGVEEKLFTPFFTTKNGGLGLGLAISRTIIERHGGRLWVTANEVSSGATFHFWLPAATSNNPARQVA